MRIWKPHSDLFLVPFRRKSDESIQSASRLRIVPVRKPLPKGEYAIILIPAQKRGQFLKISVYRALMKFLQYIPFLEKGKFYKIDTGHHLNKNDVE